MSNVSESGGERRGDERQEIGGDACVKRVDPIGPFLRDNVSRTGDEMNRRFRLGGSIDRVSKDADN